MRYWRLMRYWPLVMLIGCGAPPVEHVVIPVAPVARQALTAQDVASFELSVLSQVDKNGQPVRCDDLSRRVVRPSDATVVRLKAPISGDFTAAVIKIDDIPEGEQNRIFYIDLFNQPGELGDRVGVGCVPSVTIKGGARVSVEIKAAAPPPATR